MKHKWKWNTVLSFCHIHLHEPRVCFWWRPPFTCFCIQIFYLNFFIFSAVYDAGGGRGRERIANLLIWHITHARAPVFVASSDLMDVCVITRTILFKGLSAQSIKSAFQISTRFDNCVISCCSLSQISLPALLCSQPTPTVKLWKYDMNLVTSFAAQKLKRGQAEKWEFYIDALRQIRNQVYCLCVTIVFRFSRGKQEERTLNNKIRVIIKLSLADDFFGCAWWQAIN